jgi:hypothetical protein
MENEAAMRSIMIIDGRPLGRFRQPVRWRREDKAQEQSPQSQREPSFRKIRYSVGGRRLC